MGWFLEKLTQTTVTRYDINGKVFKGSVLFLNQLLDQVT